MGKKPRLSNDCESELGRLGAHHRGFEHYEGDDFVVLGLRDQDYRWRLAFKKDPAGKNYDCMTLAEVVQKVKATLVPVPKESGAKQ